MLAEPHLLRLFAVILVALLATAVLVMLRKRRSLRAAVLTIFVAGAISAYAAAEAMLGWPKPIRWDQASQGDGFVVNYAEIRKDRDAIYVLLAMRPIPRWLRLPYDEQTAKELRQARDRAQQNGMPLMFKFEKSLEQRRAPHFYPMPQPKLPDKPGSPPPEDRYKAREWAV